MSMIKEGDIYCLNSDGIKVIFQFISTDKNGELIRVFQNIENINLDSLEVSKDFFFLYFPVSLALENNIITYEGNFDLTNFIKPKFMRSKHVVRENFEGWHIINTETLERELFKELDEDQMKLSPFGIWNPSLLTERMKTGWNLKNW